jgi:hypothetical protein
MEGHLERRPNERPRPVIPPGALNDTVGTIPDLDRGWPPAITDEHRSIRAFIAAGLCPWCTGTRPGRNGPWVSIASHVSAAHGIDRFQLREFAGLYRHSVICSDEHHLRRSALSKRQQVQLPGNAGIRRTFSSAGRRAQAAKLDDVRSPELASRAGLAARAATTPEEDAARLARTVHTVRRRAAQRPLWHGTGNMCRHGCKCDLCRQYRRWVKGRGPKPTPAGRVERPCRPDCQECAAQIAALNEPRP